MIEFATERPTTVLVIAGICLVAVVLTAVLLLVSLRNARLLSRELYAADDRLAAAELLQAEQASKLRIVRELHEVAVYSLATIARQADAASYVVGDDPGAVLRSSAQIAVRTRETLATLRRAVSVVGVGSALPAIIPADERLVALLNQSREAGLVITFSEEGERFALPEATEVAIFRITEEALANALTHGGPGTDVQVSFLWTADGLRVLVDDDGVQAEARRQGTDPSGFAQQRRYTVQDDLNALTDVAGGDGIAEMRARADAFGGVFNAYSVPGVGFSVSAVFPSLRFDNGVHSVDLGR